MRAPLRPVVLLAGAALALLGQTTTAAVATTAPTLPVSPSPEQPAPTGPTAEPVPSAPTPSAAPTGPDVVAPPLVPTGTDGLPSASQAPVPPPARPLPGPPSDGIAPAVGQDDRYLRLSAQRQSLAEAVPVARKALADADRALLQRAGEARTAHLRASVARMSRSTLEDDVDDVVRQLYQGGDSGLASLAFVVTAGADHFVEHLGNISLVRAAADGVARQATSADVAAQAADVAATTSTARVHEAATARTRAAQVLARTQARLRSVDRALEALASVAPQVAVGPEGCPTADVPGTLRDGAGSIGAARLCRYAVRHAPTAQAALAITWAFRHLGAAYACGGAGRMLPFRADCSSLVSRAYAEGAGLRTAGDDWAPSTRDMVPWDGVTLDPHYAYVTPAGLRPGDLVLYDTCPQGGCPYKHVVLYLGDPDGGPGWMLHTNSCGDVAKVERFWGTGSTASRTFLVSRRVLALPGERITAG